MTQSIHVIDGSEFVCDGRGCRLCDEHGPPTATRVTASALPPDMNGDPPPSKPAPNPCVWPQWELADGLGHVVGGNVGLTLFDLYYGFAVVGLLAGRPGGTGADYMEKVARVGRRTAEAMLAERATREGGTKS